MEVPSDMTNIPVTFTKAVYDTVWGGADALNTSKARKDGPAVSVPVISGEPSGGFSSWEPTDTMLHQSTLEHTVEWTFENAEAYITTVSLNSGGSIITTKITFNRV